MDLLIIKQNNMQEKYLTKNQMQTILDSRPKGVSMDDALNMYVKNGWTVQGVNEPKSTIDKVKDVAIGFGKGVEKTALGVGQNLQTIGQGAMLAAGIPKEMVANTGLQTLDASSPQGKRVEQAFTATNADQKLGSNLETGAEILAGGGAQLLKTGVVSGGKLLVKGSKPVTDLVSRGVGAVKSTADEALFAPTAEEAIKTSLNPFIDNVAEVSIPVKSEGGITKYLVKNAKDATPEEVAAYKDEAGSLYNKFTTQAQKFMKERTVAGGSPVEQVGQKTDKFVEEVSKLRRSVGAQMGKIENAAENVQVPFNKSQTVQDFVLETADVLKGGAKYGPDAGITKEIQKLSDDILRLEKSGGSVKDTLNMTRKWARYLEDQKDKFGDFTANKGANMQIERVIRSIKDDARSVLSENNDTYRTLVEGYRRTSRFGEEAKRLLGQEGLYGDSIKGAATVKRAIQSNSDAGARQFLKTLRDITGYDAIKEGDIALKAMKDVGDYQGLSMLDVLSDVQGGLLGTAKNIVKKMTPDEATRVKKYINKDKLTPEIVKVEEKLQKTKDTMKQMFNNKGMIDPEFIVRDLKGKFAGVAEKFSSYDYKTMVRFLDYAHRAEVVDKETSIKLEKAAQSFLHDQGITKVPKTRAELRNAVQKIIDEANFPTK
jgi:hypothetical protein